MGALYNIFCRPPDPLLECGRGRPADVPPDVPPNQILDPPLLRASKRMHSVRQVISTNMSQPIYIIYLLNVACITPCLPYI